MSIRKPFANPSHDERMMAVLHINKTAILKTLYDSRRKECSKWSGNHFSAIISKGYLCMEQGLTLHRHPVTCLSEWTEHPTTSVMACPFFFFCLLSFWVPNQLWKITLILQGLPSKASGRSGGVYSGHISTSWIRRSCVPCIIFLFP